MPSLRTLLHPAVLWAALLLLIVATYLFGLGEPYAPTNGDEMVYIHIARMTAESGHWLPLQSELLGTRNTKPPLLIWQGIAASGWGQHWSLMALRLPSIAYTFATTALLSFFTWRLSGKRRTACLAAVLYLLYFSTFRYGRVYLTSAPETFWLALPMWWLLWLQLRGHAAGTKPLGSVASVGWVAYTLFGITLGLGAAYKSFALLASAGAALWFAILWSGGSWQWRAVLQTTAGVLWSVLLGLGVFCLWFVLDPDPAAVWKEFVLAENVGKMSNAMGYWQAAIDGPYPMWQQLLAYPVNAGLLALTALGFCWLVCKAGLRSGTYRALSGSQRVLVVWLVVWLVVFAIPSQRSERYVIPAMPALAIAMTLLWQRIPRLWSLATLLLIGPALVMLARISWTMDDMGASSEWLADATIGIATIGLVTVFLGLFNARWTRNASLVSCATTYACFNLMVAPLSQPDTAYPAAVVSQLQSKRIAVPNGFTGQYERYHFVLGNTRITPYDAEGRNTGALYPDMAAPQRLERLLQEFDVVVWLQDDDDQDEPTCLPQCTLIGERWHIRSRHKLGDVTWDNIWYPQEWLFSREWLLMKSDG